jgi:hypothetical protein
VSTRYQFVPWIRQGAATAIDTIDTLDAGVAGRPALPLRLSVNQRSDVSVTLRLFGPGDVTGLDTRAVVRTDPPHMASAFEPNYFPYVELDLPDLPWMLTPATGDAQARLRPWLCLIVVRKQPGVSLSADRNRPLPVLSIRPPALAANELPDLTDSWAWAHGQVMSTDDTPMADLLADRSRPAISRLVCPRRLQAGQSWIACLVPAFATGRKAGLGERIEPQDEAQLAPAWTAQDLTSPLDLPVYFQWEFSTGRAGDFEELVRRLRGQAVPPGVGHKLLHVGDAEFGLPDAGVLPLEGALRVPDSAAPVTVPPPFRAALEILLNRPDALRDVMEEEPIVAPPIYGSWQAAQRRLDPDTPVWLREANLDPRYRAAAGLGTLVVQDQQEQLMASAWEQLGTVGHEQRVINQRELGREVLNKVHAGLARLSPERFLHVTGPLQARVRIAPTAVIFSGQPPITTAATAREQIRRSELPVAVASAPFRRVTRPLGPLVRRATTANTAVSGGTIGTGSGGSSGTGGAGGVGGSVGPLTTRPLVFSSLFTAVRTSPVSRALSPTATVTAAAIEARLQGLIVLSTQLALASQFNSAVREMSSYLEAATGVPASPPKPGLVLGQFQNVLLQQIDPVNALQRSISEPQRAVRGTVAAPQELPGPSFPQPMYEALRELAPDLLLPGIELIPPDSITLLETNPPVIAAYMLGLNHEMSRELLWREYPSDLRATFFRRFWGGPLEMPGINLWDAASELGAQVADGSNDEQLVLLVRGELLQRYPGAVIYAVPAVDRRTPGTQRRYPLFRAALAPDLTCMGFDLSAEEVRGNAQDAGWFFVIEQPPGQARFGLDAETVTGRDPAQLASWNDVAWGDMAASPAELEQLTHAPIAGRLLHRRIDGIEWGLNAGHMAAITLQRPVRVLQHAADLLPSTEPTS